jgi:hypothetical protein
VRAGLRRIARPILAPDVPPRIDKSARAMELPGAVCFSDEPPEFFDPVQLVNWAKSAAPIMRQIRAMRINKGAGPARRAGDWGLAFLAHVASGCTRWSVWHRAMHRDMSFWRACGFDQVPAYKTMWERFRELLEFREAFAEIGDHLVMTARKHDPRVGMWLVVDGTECQTHAQPRHDCKAHEACRTRNRAQSSPRLRSISCEEATKARQSTAEFEDDGYAPPKTWERDPAADGLVPIPANGAVEVAPDGGVRFSAGGHWWRSRDAEAGLRSYGVRRNWFGSIHVKATCAFTGAVVATVTVPASTSEHKTLEKLYAKILKAVGTDPVAFVADRGWATDEVYRFLGQRGVSVVIQYRKRSRMSPAAFEGDDHVDRHGIPICRGCGLSGDYVKTEGGANARVLFRCPAPSTPKCEKVQSLSMSRNVRQILHTPRTSENYAALRPLTKKFETKHKDWREQYGVAGKNFETRLLQIGTAVQQLRSDVARIVEWIRLLVRQGWHGDRQPRTEPQPIPVGGYFTRIVRARQRRGLNGGYAPLRRAPRTPARLQN